MGLDSDNLGSHSTIHLRHGDARFIARRLDDGNADDEVLSQSSLEVYELVASFPCWLPSNNYCDPRRNRESDCNSIGR